MFKWLKKILGRSEDRHQEHNIIPRILIAHDAELVAECNMKRSVQIAEQKRVRERERSVYPLYMMEVKREKLAAERRREQYAVWKENARAVDELLTRISDTKNGKKRHLSLVM